MRTVRATLWVVFGLLRRTLREGIVLRSLVFPGAIAVGVSLGAVAVLASILPAAVIGVQGEPTAALREAAEEEDLTLLRVDDARAAVEAGRVAAATDGIGLYMDLRGAQDLVGERAIRRSLGAAWWPTAGQQSPGDGPPADPPTFFNELILRILGVLFAMYGVVFGAGGIARDRAAGLLDARLTLPLPFEVIGAARWIASSIVLSVAFAGTTAIVAAGLYIQAPLNAFAHGAAAASTGVAIGILAVGRASLDRGFAAPLSIGLSATLVLIGWGAMRLPGSTLLPIATIVGWSHPISPWPALGIALLAGVAATRTFARRTAVT